MAHDTISGNDEIYQLMNRISELEVKNKRLSEALGKYGGHTEECESVEIKIEKRYWRIAYEDSQGKRQPGWGLRPCTCGLEEALKE